MTTLSADTVRRWSNVALALNAVDHAIATPKAPGPCASSYALGLAYAAMADACAYATRSYPPALAKTPPPRPVTDGDEFVGGAIYGFLACVFTEPEHKKVLAPEAGSSPDWQTGIDFSAQFSEAWLDACVSERIDPKACFYRRPAGKHDEDPLNPGQGFYGQAWAGSTASVNIPDPHLQRSVSPLGLDPHALDAAYRPLASPPAETSDPFLKSAREVKIFGELPADIDNGPAGLHLTVGTFWAYDGAANIGTPPRLYTQLLHQIVDRTERGQDGPELARLLARANIAMANASIVAWRGKYEHAVPRPIRWIRDAKSEIRNPDWQPLGSPRSRRDGPLTERCDERAGAGVGQAAAAESATAQATILGASARPQFTPNFPAYPSGHATFGGACFKVLERFLGTSELAGGERIALWSDEIDSGTTDPFTKCPRPCRAVSFADTEELIDANSFSRIVLGVHWDFDGTDGAEAGKIIGELVHSTLYAHLPQRAEGAREEPEMA